MRWRCSLTFSAHIKVANSDIFNKNRFQAVGSLIVIRFEFFVLYQLAGRSNRVKTSCAAYSHITENTSALNQNQNKAKKHLGKIAISSLGSDRYHIWPGNNSFFFSSYSQIGISWWCYWNWLNLLSHVQQWARSEWLTFSPHCASRLYSRDDLKHDFTVWMPSENGCAVITQDNCRKKQNQKKKAVLLLP